MHTVTAAIGGFIAGESASNASGYRVEYNRDGASWSQTPIGATQVSESGTVYYRVTADNYNTVYGSVRITITPRQLSLTLTIDGWTAGNAASVPTVAGDTEGLTISYRYVGTTASGAAYDSAEAPTEAGTYMVYAVAEGDENQTALSAPVGFTVDAPAPAETFSADDANTVALIAVAIAAGVGIVATVVAVVAKRKRA